MLVKTEKFQKMRDNYNKKMNDVAREIESEDFKHQYNAEYVKKYKHEKETKILQDALNGATALFEEVVSDTNSSNDTRNKLFYPGLHSDNTTTGELQVEHAHRVLMDDYLKGKYDIIEFAVLQAVGMKKRTDFASFIFDFVESETEGLSQANDMIEFQKLDKFKAALNKLHKEFVSKEMIDIELRIEELNTTKTNLNRWIENLKQLEEAQLFERGNEPGFAKEELAKILQ